MRLIINVLHLPHQINHTNQPNEMKLHYEKRNEVIDKPKTIKFSDKEIAMINKLAKEENRTFGNFVRNAIAFYIRNRMKQTSIFGDIPPLI